MDNVDQPKILDVYPDIAERLEFFDNTWTKLNQSGSRDISEQNARDFVERNYSGIFNKFTLDQLKHELNQAAFRRRHEQRKKRDEQGWGEYPNERQFIIDMNKRHKLFEVTGSGTVKPLVSGQKKILERLKVYANNYVRETGDKSFKPAAIPDNFQVIANDMAISRKEQIKDKIGYRPGLPDPFEDLMDALRIIEKRELHKNALKHYIWQIKRKFWGYDPTYHFALILFTNRQAFGKTVFLRKFHSSIEEVFANISGDRIRDQFGAELFENYYVAFFDEMAQINANDLRLLKEFVTRDSSVSRVMYSQMNQVNRQNTTLCGTTNRPINQIIYDPSGMRRWWQINLNTKDYHTMDFEKLEKWAKEEFLCFWQAIDENDESGFYGKGLPLYEKMLEYQDTFKAVTPVQQFVDEMGYGHEYTKAGKEDLPTEEKDLVQVWAAWVGWCKATRNTTHTLQTFKNHLQEIGFRLEEHRGSNKTTGQRNRTHFLVVDKTALGDDI